MTYMNEPSKGISVEDEDVLEPSGDLGAAGETDPIRTFHGELKDYRQPAVTSLGIILGFLLSYLGNWANSSSGALLVDKSDIAVFSFIVVAVGILVVVLYRMLNPLIPGADPLRYYQKTLRLYVVGLILAFTGFLIVWAL